ncbi:NADH-quinone oxidoreductase subunit G [Nitriliruptor alkaliphilus]|uniref:NADH-quinone oxidoreductase subunit G n=1 Tax=Nitriliruptor alkaliphilus TaxID=427918 RepID=UPI0009FB6EBF|nr:NADH-quinone oxidoreductase subunit G [Nitriliruptor alkaliphilus]
MSEQPDDLVSLTIDGQEVRVPKGTLIIRAAEQLGTIVPRFCDHPLLDPVGACRQCVVEVEGQRKPVMSCTMPVAPDMVVSTHLTSEVARKGQEGTLEFLLINHPLDCPMCDKGGECPLQDQALAHGANTSRFVDQKRRYQKPVAVSAQVLLDRERCVLCARCTRFSEQISGDPFIELFERGALEQVAIYEDEPYESYFSGNVIQICPVGALTSASYRFKARPFDVVTTPSVCDHCSAGCSLTVQSRRGDIQRQLARTNLAVNEAWNCDRGRFGFTHLTAPTRVTTPKLRRGGDLVDASWAEALVTTATAIGEAAEAGSGRVAVLTGGRLADEDAYAVAKYVRTVLGSDDLDFRTRFAAPTEADELVTLVGRDGATYADVEASPVTLVVDLDPEEEVPILHLRLRKAWRDRKARLVAVGPSLGSLWDLAWRRVGTRPGAAAAALDALTAELTGDGSAELSEVAAELRAATTPPVILVGERAGAGTLTAATALADACGGKVNWVPRRAGDRGALEAGLAAGVLPGGRRLDDADDRTAVEAVWGALPTDRGRDLHAILTDAAAGKVDVLHLIGVDPLRDAASPELARKALAKAKLVVAQDLALNATVAEFADVVLPAAATQERSGAMTNWEGRTQRFARAIDAPDLVMEDWEIVQQLAAVQGRDLGFSDLAQLRAEIASLGVRATPHTAPTPAAATDGADTGDVGDDDTLELVTVPALLDHGTMLSGAVDLLATRREPYATLHSSDAERLGVADGDEVELSAGGRRVRLPARVGHDVVPGVVRAPANSTEVPARSLAAEDGSARVTVTVVARADDQATTAEVAG